MEGRDQGLGIRGSGLERLIGLGVLLGINSTALSGALPSNESKSSPGVTVRVYDYAGVSSGEMRRAEEEASRILRAAGVEIEWVDCPTSPAEAHNYPACEPPLGAMAVDLRILPPPMAARVRSSREQLGFALPSTKAGSASAAWVFFQRVEHLAESKDADQAQILGHAIAHEIGHLLLGPGRHSDKGIMRANWDRAVLQEAARGQLLFSSAQAELIKAEVRSRVEQAGTAQVSAHGSPR